MRVKNVTAAVVTDLGIGPQPPSGSGGNAIVLNLGAGAATLQESDASTGPFSTISGAAAIASNTAVNVKISKRYVAIEAGAGNLVLLGE